MKLKHSTLHVAIELGRRIAHARMVLHPMPLPFTKNPGRTKVTTRRQRRRRPPQHPRELDNQNGVNAIMLLQTLLAGKTGPIEHLRQYGRFRVGETRHLALERVLLMALFVGTLRMSRTHQIHDFLGTNEGGRKNVDQLTRMSPRHGVLERLGMDIRSHLGSDLIGKRHIALLEDRMHPANADAMGSLQVAHGRILARANHSNHGLVVVIEDEVGVSTPQLLPQSNGRQPQASHRKVGCNNFSSGVE